MAARTLELLQDPQLRKRLGKRGRRIVSEKFTPLSALNACMDVYNSVLQ